MEKQIDRKEFLRLGALGGAGLLLAPRLAGAPAGPVGGPEPEFVMSGDARYESLRQGFNRRIQRHPQAIALCRNSRDIAGAVRHAREHNLPVAIRSGGHSFEGFSSNDGGLVINLSQMSAVQRLDAATVRIGPGCTLAGLYDALLPGKQLIPAGSCGGVGVGGLTLGGGYGFFSRKYGLTCDSLTEVTLIDGKGELRSSRDDAELLWACRGGGNGNFGVVTELTFKTHPAPAAFQSHRFRSRKLDGARAAALLEKWFELAGALPPSCYSAFILNGRTLTLLVTDFEGRDAELRPTLAALRALCDRSAPGSPQSLAPALRNFYGIRTPTLFRNASAGMYRDFAEIRGCIGDVLESVVSSHSLIYQVNTLGGRIGDTDLRAAAAYPHRDRPFLSELQAYWETPGREGKLLQSFRAVQDRFRRHGITAHYANYPSLDFADWEHSYYGASLARLRAVKLRYDPDNFFRHDQSVRPLPRP